MYGNKRNLPALSELSLWYCKLACAESTPEPLMLKESLSFRAWGFCSLHSRISNNHNTFVVDYSLPARLSGEGLRLVKELGLNHSISGKSQARRYLSITKKSNCCLQKLLQRTKTQVVFKLEQDDISLCNTMTYFVIVSGNVIHC